MCGNRRGRGGGLATVEAALGGLGVPTGVSTVFTVEISSPDALWSIFESVCQNFKTLLLFEKQRAQFENRYDVSQKTR